MRYDYLLVVGPGRSGSTFLYRLLKRHPDFVFPEIKEGYYYRSPRVFERLYRRTVAGSGRVLVDIANLAYRDPRRLTRGVGALRRNGTRILLIVLLRDYRDRALSMIRFARSRGRPVVWLGPRMLERRIVQERLTPAALRGLLRLDADLLCIDFDALTRDTPACLEALAALCGSAPFSDSEARAVNESVGRRNLVLATAATLVRGLLRRLGFRRTLQSLKDSASLQQLLFVPLQERRRPALSRASESTLDAAFRECSALIRDSSQPLGRGVYLRRGGRGARGGS